MAHFNAWHLSFKISLTYNLDAASVLQFVFEMLPLNAETQCFGYW